MSSASYTVIDAENPAAGLTQATPISDAVFQALSSNMTALGLSEHIDQFTLGFFYIDVDLLQPHLTQRKCTGGGSNASADVTCGW
jgi:hypothetical protein